MRVILDLTIVCDDPRHVYNTVRKELDTDLVPMVGMQLEDAAFGREPRAIERLTMNPTHGYYLVDWQEHGQNAEHCERLKRMYLSHGWTGLEVR